MKEFSIELGGLLKLNLLKIVRFPGNWKLPKNSKYFWPLGGNRNAASGSSYIFRPSRYTDLTKLLYCVASTKKSVIIIKDKSCDLCTELDW